MIFIETPIFTRRITQLLDEDEYRELQGELLNCPERGKLIRNSGGLRKIRWGVGDKGKRGGIRVIYYLHGPGEAFLMLLAYSKNEKDDLDQDELKLLRRIVREIVR